MHRRRWVVAATLFPLATWSLRLAAHEYFAPNFKIIHPWTTPTLPNATSASAFMKFEEVSGSDRLIAARSEICERIEIVGPDVTDVPRGTVEIKEGKDSEMKPGGAHLELLGLKFPLRSMLSYPLTLVFEKAGVLETTVFVEYH